MYRVQKMTWSKITGSTISLMSSILPFILCTKIFKAKFFLFFFIYSVFYSGLLKVNEHHENIRMKCKNEYLLKHS